MNTNVFEVYAAEDTIQPNMYSGWVLWCGQEQQIKMQDRE